MKSHASFALALGLVGALSLGCYEPYRVIRAAKPNPFVYQREFSLLPVDFRYAQLPMDENATTVELEKSRRELEEGRARLAKEFARELVTDMRQNGIPISPASQPLAPSGPAFVIEPIVREMTPGDPAIAGRGTTKVKLDIAIYTRKGELLDRVEVEHSTQPDVVADTITQYETDGSILAERFAGYLQERIAPGTRYY